MARRKAGIGSRVTSPEPPRDASCAVHASNDFAVAECIVPPVDGSLASHRAIAASGHRRRTARK